MDVDGEKSVVVNKLSDEIKLNYIIYY